MSISIVQDIYWESGDGLTVYAFADAYDASWGCTHYDYSLSAELSHITAGSRGFESQPGMFVEIEAPFDGLDGQWFLNSTLEFECFCGGDIQVFSESWAHLNRRPKYVRIIGSPAYTLGPPAPYLYNVNREILDQFQRPYLRSVFVDETWSPNPPNGDCTGDAVEEGDAFSDENGIFGPDLYYLSASPPGPCSSSSTQTFVIGGHAIVTSYSVTWQHSGVNVSPNNEP